MGGRINGSRSGDCRGCSSSCWKATVASCRVINTTSSLAHAIHVNPVLCTTRRPCATRKCPFNTRASAVYISPVTMRRARYNAMAFRCNRASNRPEVHGESFRCASLSRPVYFHSRSTFRLRAERKRSKSSAEPANRVSTWSTRVSCIAADTNNAVVLTGREAPHSLAWCNFLVCRASWIAVYNCRILFRFTGRSASVCSKSTKVFQQHFRLLITFRIITFYTRNIFFRSKFVAFFLIDYILNDNFDSHVLRTLR